MGINDDDRKEYNFNRAPGDTPVKKDIIEDSPPTERHDLLHCDIINITLESITLAILAVLVVAVFMKPQNGVTGKVFLAAIALHALATVSDLVAWTFTSDAFQVAKVLTSVCNFITYLAAPLACTAFTYCASRYIASAPTNEGRPTRILAIAIAVSGLFVAALPFVNLAYPILYAIDAANVYTWGPWRMVPDNVMAFQLVLGFLITAIQPSSNTKIRIVGCILVFGIPIGALLYENLTPSLMLSYPAIAIGLLMVYVFQHLKHEKELAEQKLELAQAINSALICQIEPHFISNSLLAIEQLCINDPSKASNVIHAFSRYLRNNFEALRSEQLTTLVNEIQHTECYLAIERADPGSALEVEFDIEDAARTALLPPLTVQPIVENAVQHAFTDSFGHIRIAACLKEGGLEVAISDDGIGFDASEMHTCLKPSGTLKDGRGIGLANVRERLAIMCNGTLSIKANDKGTTVILYVPQKTEVSKNGTSKGEVR